VIATRGFVSWCLVPLGLSALAFAPGYCQSHKTLAVLGRFANPDITEASAAVASRRQPGFFWTLNDSGNEPVLYAFDMHGKDWGAWRVIGATNDDWESLALGPCTPGQPAGCLYIGDTGDNLRDRPNRTIYRVPEPRVAQLHFRGAISAVERLTYTYPDRPHNVESIYVTADATISLITKHDSVPIQFQLTDRAWKERQPVARQVGTLSTVTDSDPTGLVTDAALSPRGDMVALRTYTRVFVFPVGPSGAIRIDDQAKVCDVSRLGEKQGEGITWMSEGGEFLLTSEGPAGQITYARC
jgi:hypothetical protein